jgi:hypothetical protein
LDVKTDIEAGGADVRVLGVRLLLFARPFDFVIEC